MLVTTSTSFLLAATSSLYLAPPTSIRFAFTVYTYQRHIRPLEEGAQPRATGTPCNTTRHHHDTPGTTCTTTRKRRTDLPLRRRTNYSRGSCHTVVTITSERGGNAGCSIAGSLKGLSRVEELYHTIYSRVGDTFLPGSGLLSPFYIARAVCREHAAAPVPCWCCSLSCRYPACRTIRFADDPRRPHRDNHAAP